MVVIGSQIVVLVLGIAVCVLSAWGAYAPEKLVRLVTGVMDQEWGIYLAVIVRLLLGLALIIAAPYSRFPLVFQALGWIAIVAAVALAFMGRERLRRLVAWFERFSPAIIRLWLLFGVAFGGFLIYGIW
jgi:hypothetical protein